LFRPPAKAQLTEEDFWNNTHHFTSFADEHSRAKAMSAIPKSNKANKVVIFMVDKNKNNLFNQHINSVQNSSDFDCEIINSADEVIQYLNMTPSALLMFEIHDKESLTQVLNVMKSVEKQIKSNSIKVAGFNHLKNENIDKALKKLGCSDIFEHNIKSKTFSYKIDFWFKTLKSKSSPSDNLEYKEDKDKSSALPESTSKTLNGLHTVAAMQQEDDVWILKNKNDCKNILRRWLVKLMGPSPQVARWSNIKLNAESGAKQVWQFEYKEGQASNFGKGRGTWFFEGSRPEFDWKENVWIFSGSSAALYYAVENKVDFRFQVKNDSMFLAENSLFASSKRELIIESFNREYEFSNDEKADLENDQSFEANNLLNNKMQGKGATQKYNEDNLAGQGSRADQIDGQMSGKSAGTDKLAGNLSGKIGAQNKQEKEEDPFEGEVDQLDKYYRGDEHKKASNTDGEKDQRTSGARTQSSGPLSGTVGKSEKSPTPDSSGNFSADQLEKYYNGKSRNLKDENNSDNSTNQSADEIEKYLKNKISNQEDEEKDKPQRAIAKTKKKKGEVELDNVLPFAKKKSGGRSDQTDSSEVDENFAQVYADSEATPVEYEADAPARKEKQSEVYARDSVESNNQAIAVDTTDYDKITASGEIKISLYVVGREQEKINAHFQDLFARELILSFKDFTVSEGDSCKIQMNLNYLKENVALAIDAVATLVEEQEEGEWYVTFDLKDFPEDKLAHFMDVYSQRQANIHTFMKKVKGHE
jgi:hypothetical protein